MGKWAGKISDKLNSGGHSYDHLDDGSDRQQDIFSELDLLDELAAAGFVDPHQGQVEEEATQEVAVEDTFDPTKDRWNGERQTNELS